jgi:hypothetical protein
MREMEYMQRMLKSTSYPAVGLIAHAVVLPLLTETLSFTYHSSFPRVRTLITIPCVPTLCKLPTTYKVWRYRTRNIPSSTGRGRYPYLAITSPRRANLLKFPPQINSYLDRPEYKVPITCSLKNYHPLKRTLLGPTWKTGHIMWPPAFKLSSFVGY